MGIYTIPRNLKGETRILLIFSIKSLITTAIGCGIGAIFYLIIGVLIGQQTAGWITLGVFGLMGFVVGAVKIPTLSGVPITKKIGGESIDEIIRRYLMFKRKKQKYSYYITKEGEK